MGARALVYFSDARRWYKGRVTAAHGRLLMGGEPGQSRHISPYLPLSPTADGGGRDSSVEELNGGRNSLSPQTGS